ncbi:FLYWCH zinc finger domain-containing protein [Phthorimaea operculella]|nr:FLYWCH zinc finger domain-containing protein [Phthorimaea operculella]
MFLDNTVRWLKTRTGKQIALINGYSFYCGIETATTYTWRCSRWSKCKARFILGKNMKMLRANIEHNHQPSAFIIRDGIYLKVRKLAVSLSVIPPYEFTESRRGNCVIQMQGYRYTIKKHHVKTDRYTWRCATNHSKGCKAAIFSIGDKVVRRSKTHNHRPPSKTKLKKEDSY